MAADMFLKLDGIPGESQDDKHSGEIEIDSFSWGVSQEATLGRGTGGGAGKVNVSELNVMKKTDKASPILFLHCANGKHIPSALLTVRKAGEQPLEYYKVKMTDVMVSGLQMSGSNGGGIPMESVSLNFSKIEYEYTPQSAKGTGEGAVKAGWDLAKNAKV